jgi:hypothetical protein
MPIVVVDNTRRKQVCAWCSSIFVMKSRGHSALFCSDKCRQKSGRLRRSMIRDGYSPTKKVPRFAKTHQKQRPITLEVVADE